MKKAVVAGSMAVVLACSLGLAGCSGDTTADDGSDGVSTEESAEEDLTEEEVNAWYEDNFYNQTLTGTIGDVDVDEYYYDGYYDEDEEPEVAASYVFLTVTLDEPIERAYYEVEQMDASYFDYDVLSEYTTFAGYDEDDDMYLWWTYDDDTTFSYADGTEAAVEDLAEGDAVTITFGDRGEIVEVVIGQ